MRDRKIELTIIKISIFLACLVIGAGTLQRMVGTKAQPFANNDLKQVETQKPGNQVGTSLSTETGTSSEGSKPTLPKGKIVAIGDSYTYGYPYGIEASWVSVLSKDLNREFLNKGKASQTSSDLLKRFQEDVIGNKPETVIILIGTGDAMRGVSLENYQKNIQDMVALAKSNNITAVLGLPLPYPDTIATKLINSYREWLTAYTVAENIKLVDFNSALVDAGGGLRKELSDDGKYPNKQGYMAMADAVKKVVQ